MALLGSLSKSLKENPYRTDFPDAYFKIENVTVNTEEDEVFIMVAGYGSEYSRFNGGSAISRNNIRLQLSEFPEISNLIQDEIKKSGYAHIKTLDFFNGMTDHLTEYNGVIDFPEDEI